MTPSVEISSEHADRPARIAVAIPCFNEAPAIGLVVDQFRTALPAAEIVVFDNNSTDGSADVARKRGVRVEPVADQGKGYVVRTAFSLLGDRDALLLVDGDGTYPAEAAPLLVAPVLEGIADMTVGARQPEIGAGAMSPVRGLGNLLIRGAFRALIGEVAGDLLSGYRAFSPTFLRTVSLRSQGFEIETELAIEAVTRNLETLEISVPYRPRIAGTASKLRAVHDGLRILKTIVLHSLARGPMRLFLVYAAGIACLRPLAWVIDRYGGVRWPVTLCDVLLVLGLPGLTMLTFWIRRKTRVRHRAID